MNNKTKIIILVSVLVIILIAIVVFSQLLRKNDYVDIGETGLEMVTFEGKFQARGVVVRPEKETLTIMPILANEEYRNEEKFYYETDNQLNLKQGQEVMVKFHYREASIHEAVIDNVEVLKEKSDVEIPNDILVKAYSSKDNISVLVDNEISNNKRIAFTVTDRNELKYDYSTMKYDIRKYNSPPTSTEIIYTENGGMALSGYNPWTELPKINDISTEANYTLDEKSQVVVEADWVQVYGELGEGEYTFTLSTVSTLRQSIVNSNITEYPDDGVTIEINFIIGTNGEIEYKEKKIR